MKRRTALAALAGLPLLARLYDCQAQAQGRAFRIGLLPELSAETRELLIGALQRRGWAEGRDFVLVPPGGAKINLRMVPSALQHQSGDMASVTRSLIVQQPDVMLATSTAYARAAHEISTTIPVVMWTSGYPVEAGVAESLARPGRNVTGNSIYAGTGMWGKLLQLAKDADPAIKRVSVLWDYMPPAFARNEIDVAHAELLRDAAKLGLRIQIIEVPRTEAMEEALSRTEREHADALVVTSGWVLSTVREQITKFATARHIPVVSDFRWPLSLEPYPLLVYAAPQAELMDTAADYIVQILRGKAPAELPIQQPRRFELLLNLKTAKALGLSVPQTLRLRADEVIE